jgi:hypothetical protein
MAIGEITPPNGEIGLGGEDDAVVVRVQPKRFSEFADQGIANIVLQGSERLGE